MPLQDAARFFSEIEISLFQFRTGKCFFFLFARKPPYRFFKYTRVFLHSNIESLNSYVLFSFARPLPLPLRGKAMLVLQNLFSRIYLSIYTYIFLLYFFFFSTTASVISEIFTLRAYTLKNAAAE